MLQIKIKTGYS